MLLSHLCASSLALIFASPARASTSSPQARQVPTESPDKIRRSVSSELFNELDELSRLVGISYCVGSQGIQKPFTCLSHCDEFPGLQLVQSWDSGLLQNSCGYIALSHAPTYAPRILVLFRGTNSLQNFLADLQTSPAKYIPYRSIGSDPKSTCTNCTVHSGFMAAWNATRDKIMPQLRVLRQSHPDYEIVLAGHSLGGALAGIAGIELRAGMGWEGVSVTSFGEPRWGNQELAAFVDETFECDGHAMNKESAKGQEWCAYRRVTHVGDPVPFYPPAEWGWRSHGGEIYISKGGVAPEREDVILCEGAEDPNCIAGSDRGTSNEVELAKRAIEETKELRTQALAIEKGRAAAETALLKSIEPLLEDNLWGILQQGEQSGRRAGKREQTESRDWLKVPTRWKVWGLLFAHREYFSRLGLCYDPVGWQIPAPGLVDVTNEL